MSTKSRKKSSKSSPGKKSGGHSSAAANAKAGTNRGSAAGKSVKKSVKKASSGSSHKAASKSLKSKAVKTTPPKSTTPLSTPKMADSAVLAEGAKAPGFRLPRDGGSIVSLSDFAGQKLVLFFYPKANTPGCTKEAIDFTRLSGDFAESGTAVLGVSADPEKAQVAFRDKHQLSVPLISDEKHEMLGAYGVWGEKSLYGRTFLGIVRTTVLVDAGGRIARIWRNVRVDGHADAVLAAARAL
jgi:thioredoxin-dependent peroxiredoxin